MSLRGALSALAIGVADKISDRAYLSVMHRVSLGRWPQIDKPQTFNENLLTYKFASRGDPRFTTMVDKIDAKPAVAEMIGEKYIIPTLWHGTDVEQLRQQNLSMPYVIKGSHGWAQNYFVRSGADLDWPKIEAMARRWLSERHGRRSREYPYLALEPRILVEPFIGSGGVLPVDYKLFTFAGKVAFIQVDEGRETEHTRTMFTPEWKPLPARLLYPNIPHEVQPPVTLPLMLASAEKLGKEFPFARIDFYDVDGAMYFGEMTFFPEGGNGRFQPDSFDRELGELWPG